MALEIENVIHAAGVITTPGGGVAIGPNRVGLGTPVKTGTGAYEVALDVPLSPYDGVTTFPDGVLVMFQSAAGSDVRGIIAPDGTKILFTTVVDTTPTDVEQSISCMLFRLPTPG